VSEAARGSCAARERGKGRKENGKRGRERERERATTCGKVSLTFRVSVSVLGRSRTLHLSRSSWPSSRVPQRECAPRGRLENISRILQDGENRAEVRDSPELAPTTIQPTPQLQDRPSSPPHPRHARDIPIRPQHNPISLDLPAVTGRFSRSPLSLSFHSIMMNNDSL